ncbi:MAG TPA: helix-turn-helix transcriptional regulator [Acidimicrobiia bacterium]|nr:helix-turn-helix transcriptional regulator [Acidimicrobiia bacterium]
MLELAVLGLLKEQPLHGYELKKRLGETLGFLWGVSYGSLYPALRRLERDGAIEIVLEPAPAPARVPPTGSLTGDLAAARRAGAARRAKATRRTRKAYRITDRGERQFTELLLADDAPADDEKTFALRLAFCGHVPREARLELLERRRAALVTRLERSRRAGTERWARLERAERPGAATRDRYARALVEHRTKSTQRDLEWVEELIAAERAATDDEPATPQVGPQPTVSPREGAPA